jgi:hypothetical protein
MLVEVANPPSNHEARAEANPDRRAGQPDVFDDRGSEPLRGRGEVERRSEPGYLRAEATVGIGRGNAARRGSAGRRVDVEPDRRTAARCDVHARARDRVPVRVDDVAGEKREYLGGATLDVQRPHRDLRR